MLQFVGNSDHVAFKKAQAKNIVVLRKLIHGAHRLQKQNKLEIYNIKI